jgi:hypothetical protein
MPSQMMKTLVLLYKPQDRIAYKVAIITTCDAPEGLLVRLGGYENTSIMFHIIRAYNTSTLEFS